MSHKVTTLVYSRKAGSAVRKAVLAYMADRASDDGSGVWASKQTIADEIECGRSTVIRVCNEFVSEGILVATGTRKCANGATVEYTLSLEAIARLPKLEKQRKESQSGTSPDQDQSQSGTPLVPERDPKPSQSGTQTIHEPSMNQDTNVSLSPQAISQHFDEFWEAFPHRNGKKSKRKDAEAIFNKAIKGGVPVEQIAQGVRDMYRDPDVHRGYGRGPVPWLNQRGWEDEIPETPQFKTIDGGRNERTNRTENEQRPDPALEQIFRLARVEQTPGDGRG